MQCSWNNHILKVEVGGKMKFSKIGYLLAIVIHTMVLFLPIKVFIEEENSPEKKIELIFERHKPSTLKPKQKLILKSKSMPTDVQKQQKQELAVVEKEKEVLQNQTISNLKSEVTEETGIVLPAEETYDGSHNPVNDIESIFESDSKTKAQLEPVSGTQSKIDKDKILKDYLLEIQRKIENSKQYPEFARRNEIEGDVKVEFLVNRDGVVNNMKILFPSNYKILNDSAVATIRGASPFPPIPTELEKDSLTIKLTIIFKLEN